MAAQARVFGPHAEEHLAAARRRGGQRQRGAVDGESFAVGLAKQQVHRRRADEAGDEGGGGRR